MIAPHHLSVCNCLLASARPPASSAAPSCLCPPCRGSARTPPLQRCFVAARDQLRRRLLPLLGHCLVAAGPPGDSVLGSADYAAASGGTPAAAGAAAAVSDAAAGGGAAEGGAAGLGATAAGAAGSNGTGGGGAGCEIGGDVADCVRPEWGQVAAALSDAQVALAAACVPGPVAKSLMEQAAGVVDAQLFNQLLLRPELCAASHARSALRGLKAIDGALCDMALSRSASLSGSGGGGGSSGGGGGGGGGPVGGPGGGGAGGAWRALDHTRQVGLWPPAAPERTQRAPARLPAGRMVAWALDCNAAFLS